MKQVTLLPGQSILDFCLQTCGTIEVLFELLKANGLNDLFIAPLTDINVDGLPKKSFIVDYYETNKIKPATIDGDFLAQFSLDFNDDFNDDFPVWHFESEGSFNASFNNSFN